MMALTDSEHLLLLAFGTQLPVAFGAGEGQQLEACVERLQWENPRLTQRARGKGRKTSHGSDSRAVKLGAGGYLMISRPNLNTR